MQLNVIRCASGCKSPNRMSVLRAFSAMALSGSQRKWVFPIYGTFRERSDKEESFEHGVYVALCEKGDPLYDLEMTIENFPLDRERDWFNAVPQDEEWRLFMHAMRNAMDVADERPEIKSRIKAGMLLWNKYAKQKVWGEVDGEYKDVEPWAKSLEVRSDLIADSMGKMILYKEMVEQANQLVKHLDRMRSAGTKKEASTSAAGAASSTMKQNTRDEEAEVVVPARTRTKASAPAGAASSNKKQKAQDEEEEEEAVASRTRSHTRQ